MNLDWMTDAACAGRPAFFSVPDDDEGDVRRNIRERAAKRVCADCPVISECYGYGELLPADLRKYSVFGGVAPTDRARMRRRVKAVAVARQQQGEGTAA